MWFICKFLQELEDQVTSDRNLNQMSLNKEFAFLGLHDQNSGKARRRYHGNSPPGTSRFHFLLGWVALSDQLHVGRTASTPLRLSMGEFRHERAWKEGTEASGWRSNQRRGPGRVLRAPSPGRTCSTQTPPLNGGAFLSHLPWLSFCVTDACSRGKQRNGLRKWITERAPGNEFWAPFIFSNQKPFPR